MPINKSHLIDHSPSLSSERSLSQKEGSFHGAKTEEQELESILSSRDDFSAENILSEEWKQQDSEEVCTAISEYLVSFEAQKEELLSQLGARYESQIKSLELRGMNRK